MTLEVLRSTKRDEILRVAARRGARNVRVFGSVARGDNDARSDIDFLVDLEPGRSLFDLSGLLLDLQAMLQTDVDVVTERGLRDRIRDRVLREAVPLCETTANAWPISSMPSNSFRGLSRHPEADRTSAPTPRCTLSRAQPRRASPSSSWLPSQPSPFWGPCH